jgi:hypothetical protein
VCIIMIIFVIFFYDHDVWWCKFIFVIFVLPIFLIFSREQHMHYAHMHQMRYY